jgi:hypothetical protein
MDMDSEFTAALQKLISEKLALLNIHHKIVSSRVIDVREHDEFLYIGIFGETVAFLPGEPMDFDIKDPSFDPDEFAQEVVAYALKQK